MSGIYDQHQAAFSSVSAYVILKNGERVGSVAFKFPRDGAGRLSCYFHIFGGTMVKGTASGYGYDKRSAAAEDAVRKINPDNYFPEAQDNVVAIKAALGTRDGVDWDRRIQDAGFVVLQAV